MPPVDRDVLEAALNYAQHAKDLIDDGEYENAHGLIENCIATLQSLPAPTQDTELWEVKQCGQGWHILGPKDENGSQRVLASFNYEQHANECVLLHNKSLIQPTQDPVLDADNVIKGSDLYVANNECKSRDGGQQDTAAMEIYILKLETAYKQRSIRTIGAYANKQTAINKAIELAKESARTASFMDQQKAKTWNNGIIFSDDGVSYNYYIQTLQVEFDEAALLHREDGWQLIETAPKDGGCFLGFDPTLNCVFIGHMFKFSEGFKFVANAIVRDAEYWMPLPKPPLDAIKSALERSENE